ncbi:TPA: hypothetical protein ONA81_005494 [Pseudomonas aeruginosa]|uniref:hypothetical protein n=1 Tax=Pseudomonas aeruginosa TaxID=287 RepID=UPI000F5455B4|nr:hypothetical protein [Pseudomonas aeruginosa]RPM25859.1 hypothetical protein IPC1293_31305 [Pseudomonas aeruginosa]HBP6080712.1 hypothetical protein [Pseudomonas aeruginosa]HBP6093619.1 hypothetical protein [Pseudomonas aeruginosa]HCR1237264.1 hypothetical protein [Pseudomonas aeruginosa]HCR1382151.1 hypothetical protein [Pseudomonas aeruginosa]
MPDDVIEPYKERFKEIVLQHMKTLPNHEWLRLRQRALDGIDRMLNEPATPDATPEQVLAESLSSAGMAICDVIKGKYKEASIVIGEIEGQPVYYVDGTGYYTWGRSETEWPIWDASVTFPSYPFGW